MYTFFLAFYLFALTIPQAHAYALTPDQKAMLSAAWTRGCMVPQPPPIDPLEQAWLIEECIKDMPQEFKN